MTEDFEIVNRAFSKQSVHYDFDDYQNPILQQWRKQVYNHVSKFLKPPKRILELNAGTGLDALHFALAGNSVHATDLSDGMVYEIEKKIQHHNLDEYFTCQQISYADLHKISNQKFDYIFSNFGGLNCIDDLSKVTTYLPSLLNNGGFVTWVIMPKVCPWEIAGVLKARGNAFRRFKSKGSLAHLEGEYFQTFYHSLSDIKRAFPPAFRLLKSEGLGALSPPPHQDNLAKNNVPLYSFLINADKALRTSFPFNRWADHIIVTFQYHV